MVIGKNELLAWINEIEKTNKMVHKVERIDFINIDQLTQDMKLMAMKSNENNNFDMSLFYNFASEQIILKPIASQKKISTKFIYNLIG